MRTLGTVFHLYRQVGVSLFTVRIFAEVASAQWHYVKVFDTKLHEKSTDVLAADTVSQTDRHTGGRGPYTRCFFERIKDTYS
jgi:hypothetical protein